MFGLTSSGEIASFRRMPISTRLRDFVRLSCIIWLVCGVFPAFGEEPNLKSYILVDVGKVSDTEVKGLSSDGFLTIARYDAASNDLTPSAHEWKAGKIASIRDRAIAVRSPVQKLRGVRQFLLEVEPGTWVIESSNGTVFTKGTWSFVVPEGAVVDLGIFRPVIGWQTGDKRESIFGAAIGYALKPNYPLTPNNRPKSRPIHLEWHTRADADIPLPASLNNAKVIKPVFTRVTFNNYLPSILNIDGFTNCIDAPMPVACDE